MTTNSGAFFSLRCLIYKVHAAFGGTLLLYQHSGALSTAFFRPRELFPSQSPKLSSRPTALLDYQIKPDLSTHFLQFFPLFLSCPALSPILGNTSVQNRKWAVQPTHDMV
jgi:hypothetical protein